MARRSVVAVIPEHENHQERRRREAAARAWSKANQDDTKHSDDTGGQQRLAFSRRWGKYAPDAGWGPSETFPPPHRATSRTVGVAYPFLSGAGLGPNGVAMGHLLDGGGVFCFDPWDLYARKYVTDTAILLIGGVGAGKSTTAKAMASRMMGLGRRVFVASDPKNEWVPLARQVGGQVIEIGPGLEAKLNPLDPPPRDPEMTDVQYEASVLSRRRLLLISVFTVVLDRKLTPAEFTAVDVFLAAANQRVQDRPLTLVDLWDELESPSTTEGKSTVDDAAQLHHGLRRLVKGDLAGLFDGESTVTLSSDSPMVVVATGAFEHAGEEARNLATLLASEWLESAIMIRNAGQRLVIYDEGYRMLRNEQQLQRMSDHWKLARTYGLTNVLIMHRISDLDAIGEEGSSERNLALGLLADTEIRIVGKQGPDQVKQLKATLGTTDTVTAEIEHLHQGEFVWLIKDLTFLVHTDVTDFERKELFNTDARMGTAKEAETRAEVAYAHVEKKQNELKTLQLGEAAPTGIPILPAVTATRWHLPAPLPPVPATETEDTSPVPVQLDGADPTAPEREPAVNTRLAALVASTPAHPAEPPATPEPTPHLPSLTDLPPMPAPPMPAVPSTETASAPEPDPVVASKRKRLGFSKQMAWVLAGAIAAAGVLTGGGAIVSAAGQPHASASASQTVAGWTRINGVAASIPGAAVKPVWTTNVPDGGVASVSDAAVMLVVPGSPTAQVQLLNPETGQLVWSGPSTGTIPWAVSTNVGDALAEVWLDGTTLNAFLPSTGQLVSGQVSQDAKFSEFGESLMVTDGDQVSTLTPSGLTPVRVQPGLTPVAVDGTSLLSVDSAGDLVSSDLAGKVLHRGVAKAPSSGLVFKGWITAGHGRAATVWTPSSPDGTATIGYQTTGGRLTGRVKVSTTRVQQTELTRGVGGQLSSYAGVVFDSATGQVQDLAKAGFTISTATGGWVNGNLKSTRVATDFARTVRSLKQPAAVTSTTVIIRSGPQISGFALAKEKK